jgi:uncharacterized membrane protein YhfC
MPVTLLTLPLNGLLMIAIPLLIGAYITRRFKLGWSLFWIGGITFILSQVGHIPFNAWFFGMFQKGTLPMPPEALKVPFFALLGGLSAGVWEECARYVTYRWWAKDARTFGKGTLLGAGHGGMEAIILGCLVLYTFASMLALRGRDLATVVPTEQLALAQEQVNAYWSTPLGLSLIGAVERLFSIPFHIACSVIVLQVFLRKQIRWLWLAILLHTLVDTLIPGIAWAMLRPYDWGAYAVEGLLGLTVLLDLAILRWLYTPEPSPEENELPPLPEPLSLESLEDAPETSENLENSRYNNGR